MKTLLVAALFLFLGALAHFCWRGLDAYSRAAEARTELAGRVAAVESLRTTRSVVSGASWQARVAQRDALMETIGRRRLRLLDASLFRAPAPLSTLLPQGPALPVTPEVLASWEQDRFVERALARVLSVLQEAKVGEVLRIALPDEGRLRPVPGAPGISALAVEVEIREELSVALEALERMAPGQGEPVLSVNFALLTRVDPESWPSLPGHVRSPPVRLAAKLQVLFATVVSGEGAP